MAKTKRLTQQLPGCEVSPAADMLLRWLSEKLGNHAPSWATPRLPAKMVAGCEPGRPSGVVAVLLQGAPSLQKPMGVREVGRYFQHPAKKQQMVENFAY